MTMNQASLDARGLQATLQYWRACGIDRLSGDQFGFTSIQTKPVPFVLNKSEPVVVPVSNQEPVQKPVAPPVVTLNRLLTEPVSAAEKVVLIADLRQEVSVCQQCRLSLTRNQTVFGHGSLEAPVVFIGDAPRVEEEQANEPFVGEGREILNGMLLGIGLNRHEVFITNTIKCRPPADRHCKSDELQMCQSFLYRQLEIIRPKAIFAMGKVAIDGLLGRIGKVGGARGKIYSWRGIPVITSYHPAYCQRAPSSKRAVWADLIVLMQLLEKEATPRSTEPSS